MMQLSASDFYSFHRPSKCELRVYLRHQGQEEAPPGPYQEVIRRLGERHELEHLRTFRDVEDISEAPIEEAESLTRQAVTAGAPVIYQAILKTRTVLDRVQCQITGRPDFLIRETDNYVVHDCKISRRINERDHPEILRQLELYGWLYEQTFGRPPVRLEVYSGTREIVEIPYDGGAVILEELADILRTKRLSSRPYSPVGWTKCGGCGFYDYCWPIAEQRQDPAIVAGVDQGLALELNRCGIRTIDDFCSEFDETSLAELRRPWGARLQRVGQRAASILRAARSLSLSEEIMIQPPAIPESANYVMFDIEGLPPQMDELDKVYLWGLQVFGEQSGEFIAATAGFGEHGDREGWLNFLCNAKSIFEQHSDIPFVHWHHYEKTNVKKYIERFGDPDGTASQILENLLDLLPITQNSMALPLPSYSLKVVEQYVGFKRRLEEYGGDWAMAKYIEATETEDGDLREQVMFQILEYNREDLEATWAVLKWLKSKC